ncbi:hypothetical protein ACIXNK_19855 [Bacteroides fragilis]
MLQLFCRHLKTADTFPTDSYIHIEFYPGLLMAGILTYLLIQLFFAFPGVSFGLITGISSVAVFILMSGLSLLLKT